MLSELQLEQADVFTVALQLAIYWPDMLAAIQLKIAGYSIKRP
jgi:hypothetical protein